MAMAQELERSLEVKGPSYAGPSLMLRLGGTNAQPAEVVEDTNSPVAQIRLRLSAVEAMVADAVRKATNALASSPEKHEERVRRLAQELRGFANGQIGSGSELCKKADAVMGQMQKDIAEGERRMGSTELKSETARNLYEEALKAHREELKRLSESRQSADKVRDRLVEEAGRLEEEAVALGFVEHCASVEAASKAFRRVMLEAQQFAEDLRQMVRNVGKATVRVD